MVEDDGRGVFVMTTEIGTRFVTPGESRDTSDRDSSEESDRGGHGRQSPSRKLHGATGPKNDG